MHLAAAVDARLVALHGPTNPTRWGLVSDHAIQRPAWSRECSLRPLAEPDFRMGWDSNPRNACTLGGFQDRCLKPLGHPSKLVLCIIINNLDNNFSQVAATVDRLCRGLCRVLLVHNRLIQSSHREVVVVFRQQSKIVLDGHGCGCMPQVLGDAPEGCWICPQICNCTGVL